jgi:ribosomal protein S18 acetylase RimI-like enzyme
MSEPYLVRRATPADFDRIIVVVDEWWGRPIADSLPRLFLDHFFTTSAVVESGGELVAFFVGFLSPSQPAEAYIHFVGVHPDHRAAGIARRLYEEFFAFAARAGRTRVRAITAPTNSASIAFHERLGFIVSRAIGGYNRPGTAHIVFERALEPPSS